MDLRSLADGLADIVRGCATTEMNGNRVLAGRYIDHGRGRRKQSGIFSKITDSQRSRHNDESQWLAVV